MLFFYTGVEIKNVLLNWQQNVKIKLCNHTLKFV